MKAEQTAKPRLLGFWMCLALVVGNMIGSGVFLLPTTLAPYGWNAIFGWILTIGGSFCLAYVIARLARSFPLLGGPYAYARRAFGEATAFAIAWSYWISLWVVGAVLAITAVSYLSMFFPIIARVSGLPAMLAIGFVWLFTLVNCIGTRAAGWVQIFTTILKLLPLLAAIIITFLVIADDGGASLAPLHWGDINASAITSSAALTLWAMCGFEAATVPAARVHEPERNIPRATIYGTLVTGIIYIFVCSGVALLLPPGQAAQSNAPIADFVGVYWGSGPALLVAFFASISALGALNGWLLVQAEVPLALAKDSIFPRWFGVATDDGTPVRALLLSSVIITMLLLCNYQRSMANLFEFMILLGTVAVLIMYFVCALAALRLMHTNEMGRSRLVGIVAVVGGIYSIWTFYGAGLEAMIWGLVLLATGMPIYLFMRRSNRLRAAASVAPQGSAV